MADNQKFQMTQAGKDAKVKELQRLENEVRNEISEQIKYAKSLGDFSENAELDAARDRERANESAILNLRYQIENAEIINANHYVIEDLDDHETYEYTLVGSAEASFTDGKISLDSPFGKAVKDAKVGDIVTIKVSDTNEYQVKILEIKAIEG